MQLYKSRGFNEFFQDTFSFLKLNGKHLFKHFFIINGIFLIILMTLGYFFTKFYSEIVMSSFDSPLYNNENGIDSYMDENLGLFILFLIIFVIVALVAGIISYAYVPLYLKLYNKNSNTDFDTKDIINAYKENAGKIIIFLLCSILIAIPVIIIMFILLFLLFITIIGILATPLVIAFTMLFFIMTLMEYMENKRGIWDSFGYAWTLIFSKFWAVVGCAGIFIFIAYIIQNVIALIPYIFGMVSIFSTIEQPENSINPEEIAASMTIMMLLVFFLTFVVSTVLNVITQLNQGVIYYGLKENTENTSAKNSIDQIGSGE